MGALCLKVEGHGLSKKQKVQYFDPQRWRSQKLAAMTNAALKEKNEAFIEAHKSDTNAQLLDYLRKCAEDLGHTPHPKEVYGSNLLIERFGGWSRAIAAAGLPEPTHQISRERRLIYTSELKEQNRVFKEKQEEARAARKAANQAKAEAAHAEKQARLERDAQWGEAHCDMTDEELLSYLRQCAVELGHTPYSYEVVGGKYLSQRFGSWGMVIYRAGLPELKGVKGPTAAEKAALRAEVNGCQPGRDPEAYK